MFDEKGTKSENGPAVDVSQLREKVSATSRISNRLRCSKTIAYSILPIN